MKVGDRVQAPSDAITQVHERFCTFMLEIFQINTPETEALDFGIYRVLNYRRTQLARFLTEDLPERIQAGVRLQHESLSSDAQYQYQQLRQQVVDTLGAAALTADGLPNPSYADLPIMKRYAAAYQQSRQAAQSGEREKQVYEHLLAFFGRYYDQGDFGFKRFYTRAPIYRLPGYHGDDTLLFWSTRDMHYCKSGNLFRHYRFQVSACEPPAVVEFRVAHAPDLPQNNSKGGQRIYVPSSDPVEWDAATRTLVLQFDYRPLAPEERARWETGHLSSEEESQQPDLIEWAIQESMARLQPLIPEATLRAVLCAGVADRPSLLLTKLRHYMRGKSSDFFIHPQLGRFLAAELEFFLLTEVLRVQELALSVAAIEPSLAVARVIRSVAGDVIALLQQVEQVQQRAFERPKWVLERAYLITLDRVPAALRAAVFANERQRSAWRQLFAWNGIEADAPASLVVDTRLFEQAFTDTLLSQIGDLDAQTTGWLVRSENYQALALLQQQFGGGVRCIYIDPPYNTGSDGFLYRDDFQRHSAWLTMMQGRLQQARTLLSDDGVIFVSIDDHEQPFLRMLLDQVFGAENFVASVVWQKVFSPKNTAQYFSEDHEYILIYTKEKNAWRPGLLQRSAEAESRYNNSDNDPRGPWSSSDLTARNYYSDGQYEVTSPAGATFRPAIGTYWRVSKENFAKLQKENRIWWGTEQKSMPRLKRFRSDVKEGVVPQTLWRYEDVGHTQEAKKELVATVLFERSEDMFNTLKPTRLIQRILNVATDVEQPDLILDFFAGSGSTGHAVIDLNRADGGQRRFVLVEQEEYFESVLVQRIQKAIFSDAWKDGQPHPEKPIRGSSALVAVLTLEQYEDALNNLIPSVRSAPDANGQSAMDGVAGFVQQQLLLDSAGVDFERLRTAPLDYAIRVGNGNGGVPKVVDVPATAALLLGLREQRRVVLERRERPYLVVRGEDPSGQQVLIIWRTLPEIADLDAWKADQVVLRDLVAEHGIGVAEVWVNGDCVIEAGSYTLRSTDELWETRMELLHGQ